MSAVVLSALHGHHPLGFFAACGALRVATDKIAPCKLAWSLSESIWKASLDCESLSDHELTARLLTAVAEEAKSYLACLDAYKITEAEAPLDNFRDSGLRALRENDREQAEMALVILPSIGSDLVFRQKGTGKNKKTVIQTTRFAMTSGQQDLVSGMRKVAARLAKRSKNGNVPSEIVKAIEEALFGPWRYEDDEHPLGWDPQVQRLHALRNKAPTNDAKKRSVCGAVFLATQALPLFPCFAINNRLRTTGFHRDKNAEDWDWFAWPIWNEPISLGTLRTLLAHPHDDLRDRGIQAVYCCRRAPTGGAEGDYRIFSSSEEVLVHQGGGRGSTPVS
jgi:hypothetical protein